MKEMDLEELDQEVSKLMDQASKAKAKPASEPPAVASTPKVADDSAGTPVTVRRASLQITPRKQGIAMDIVQPQVATPPPPSSRPARVAPTLQPTKSVAPDEPGEVEPAEKVEKEEPKAQKDDVSDSTLAAIDLKTDGKTQPSPTEPDETIHKSVWPDPLELHGFKEDDGKKQEKEPATAEEDKEDDKPAPEPQPTMQHTTVITPPTADEDEANEEQDEKRPEEVTEEPEVKDTADADEEVSKKSDSPFVDTKVEKRPLGAYTDTKPVDSPKIDDPTRDGHAMSEEPAATHGEPASIAIQTPKELSAEVVAVESAEPEFTPGAPKTAEADEPSDMDSLRQMTIPQQYHETEKEPSHEDRPVFDTKEYHPPLQPAPAAPHPGRAGTIITIILILLMISAATLAYFVVTGTIDISRLL